MGDNQSESKLNKLTNTIKDLPSHLRATLMRLRLRIPFSFTAPLPRPSTQTQATLLPISTTQFTEVQPYGPYPNPYSIVVPPNYSIPTRVLQLQESLSIPFSRFPSIRPTQVQPEIFINESYPLPREDPLPSHPMVRLIELLPGSSPSRPYVNIVSFFMAPNGSSNSLEDRNQQTSLEENSNPIISAFRENELGKTILGVSVPMATGLLATYKSSDSSLFVCLVAIALSLGYAATWNGVLLRQKFPGIANSIEQLGVGFILVAFFVLLGSMLPANLLWVPWLGCGLSVLPFMLSLFK